VFAVALSVFFGRLVLVFVVFRIDSAFVGLPVNGFGPLPHFASLGDRRCSNPT
jgi:hypothetical protein